MKRILLVLLLAGCGGGGAADAPDAAPDAPADPAAACATTFGTALPAGFVRVDGTVLAVVPAAHPTCARPNGTHVVVQVTVAGAAYRMVVNIASDRGDPDVRFGELAAPLVGPPWQEGIHTGIALDYVQTFNLHAGQAPFAPLAAAALSARLAELIPVGSRVAVYSSGSGGDSTHLVHRNRANQDGAIVIGADTSPRFLLFHFADQSF